MPRKRPPNLDPKNERTRELSEAEQRLWQAVTELEMPLLPEQPPAPTMQEEAQEECPPAPVMPQKASEAQIADWLEKGLLQNPPKPPHATPPANGAAQGGVDWKTARQMRQGKLEPEDVLDLHGYTQKEAHARLIAFLTHCRNKERRCVLVITGKGRPRAGREAMAVGVLRESLPTWLRAAPCNTLVTAFTPAHIRHGGDGAFYILLRKPAKHP